MSRKHIFVFKKSFPKSKPIYEYVNVNVLQIDERRLHARKKHDSLSRSAPRERASESAEQTIERHDRPKRSAYVASISLPLLTTPTYLYKIINQNNNNAVALIKFIL